MKPCKLNVIHHRNGFTLVELLVVITIIVVLASVAFVGSRRLADSASKTKSMGYIKQLAVAAQLFSAENNGAILDWTGTTVLDQNGQKQKRNWSEHLLVTLQGDLALNDDYKKTVGDNTARALGIFSDPKALKTAKSKLATTGHNSWRTYAYNNRIGTYTPDSPEPIPYKQGAKFNYQVDAPNKLILISQRILDGDRYFSFLQPEDANNKKIAFDLYKGSIPVGYYDGHSEVLKKQNFPSAVGAGINPTTGKAFTQAEWREHWWGRGLQVDPL